MYSKTVMQELMAHVKIKKSKDFGKIYVIEICDPEKIKELLEKEKQQIMDAWDSGSDTCVVKPDNSEHYFNSNYGHE